MSSDDEDITKIEDLVDFNHDEEDEEDIPSLEDMASELGLSDLPDLPSEDTNEEDLSETENDFPTELPPEVNEELDSSFDSSFESSFESSAESFGYSDEGDSDEGLSNEDSTDEMEPAQEDFSAQQESFDDFETEPAEPESESESESEPEVQELSEADPSEPETEWKPELTNTDYTSSRLTSTRLVPEEELTSKDDFQFEASSPETKTEITKTKIDYDPVETWSEPEPLEDLTHFAKEQTHVDYSAEGNPPFSIIVKNLRYYEDIDGIIEVLREFNLTSDEDSMRENLTHGQVLIPRLSEYVAIILCHKLRVFDCEILMGLTEEIHPPKSYESQDRGMITKKVLNQNKRHHFKAKDLLDNSLVMTTTLNQIEGHIVKKHIGVITHSTILNSTDLNKSSQLEDEIIDNISTEDQRRISKLRLKRENYLASQSDPDYLRDITEGPTVQKQKYGLDSVYKDLLEEIRVKAIEEKANGVIGINFTITPISIDSYLDGGAQYQVVCSGNLVWLERN